MTTATLNLTGETYVPRVILLALDDGRRFATLNLGAVSIILSGFDDDCAAEMRRLAGVLLEAAGSLTAETRDWCAVTGCDEVARANSEWCATHESRTTAVQS